MVTVFRGTFRRAVPDFKACSMTSTAASVLNFGVVIRSLRTLIYLQNITIELYGELKFAAAR